MAKEEQIRELAYAIWEREGRPAGKDEEHYHRARKILEEQEASATGKSGQPPQSSERALSSGKRKKPAPRKKR